MRRLKYLTTALALLLATPALAQNAPQTIALIGGNVIGIDGEPTITNAVVLIEGDRIKQVGSAASVSVPDGTRTISMQGKWLIPGLMNMHVHLGLKLNAAMGGAKETAAEQVLRMAANARRSLLAGITTVRLTGTDNGNDFALRAAINRGDAIGPRIRTCGQIIAPTGGHGELEADGPYAMAHVVREQIKGGADCIKIAISGGIGDAHGDISAAPMTDEELAILIEVAHRNGIKVTAHNGSAIAAAQALKLGIDGFEHGYHLDDTALKLMKSKGVWLVPTIVVSQKGAREFYAKIGLPALFLARAESTSEDHWAMLKKAIALGVPIALGTDQFPFEPYDGTTATVREAEFYVEAGMTSLQALQAATIKPAKMLAMEQDVGRIASGKYADIVAVDADPIANIRALRSIFFVMKGGVVVRDDRGVTIAQ
jgi:imidazolonepropionase-like amidohydrolase